MKTRIGTLAVLTTALACAPAAAQAKSVVSNLRVEAGGKALDGGTSYVNGSARIQTDQRPACGGSGKVASLAGPTALGLLKFALPTNGNLKPLGVSDKFSFGLVVCGIDDSVAFSTNQNWLYKVDHKSPEVGADQFRLKRGDRVLWYFTDADKNSNTGDELALSAPARAKPNAPFTVTVYSYDANGKRTPAAGAQVTGATVQTTDADGHATVAVDRTGAVRLRATRGADIASAPVRVCLNAVASKCPARRGERIVGTNGSDRITDTAGDDTIYARRGNDRIDVRGGGRDTVHCGPGRDFVRADRHDRVSRDCERVSR